jgi:hypothetical protein
LTHGKMATIGTGLTFRISKTAMKQFEGKPEYVWRADMRKPEFRAQYWARRIAAHESGFRWVLARVVCKGGYHWGIFGTNPEGQGLYHFDGESWELLSDRKSRTSRPEHLCSRVGTHFGCKVTRLASGFGGSGNWPIRGKEEKHWIYRRIKCEK